jgi:hypothetical protein
MVPNGSVRCAAVKPVAEYLSPLLVRPELPEYHDATPHSAAGETPGESATANAPNSADKRPALICTLS